MSYSGDCNSCGKCCTGTTWNPHEQKLVTVYCENLILGETPGRPQATMCAAHKTKTLGMKVIFYTGDGVGSYEGQCLSIYPRTQDAIPPECSYKWQGNNKQPRWPIGYAPSLGNLISEIY
jgi:uncharacterized cysteine cluster protein YcgN (CxxCxxCC family)